MGSHPPTSDGAGHAVAANRAFYDQLRSGQDDYWRHMAAPRHRVSVLLRELASDRPASVVDLGCGNGAMLLQIAARVPTARLAGVDLSAPRIEQNRSAMPAIDWHTANLDGSSPAPVALRERFDAVVAMEVIEHLDDPGSFLREASALAAGRGRLYLSTQSGRVGETERRVGHRRHFTRREVSELLARSGWVPLRVWNTGWPFHDLSKWYANLTPDRSMSRFGAEKYGLSQKAVCAALRVAFALNSRSRGAQLFAVARRA
jgi:2-polyprenyl-3-methyl-5-hydroxy-6-metoxy-1,4-benzoquinol methylase